MHHARPDDSGPAPSPGARPISTVLAKVDGKSDEKLMRPFIGVSIFRR
jgi:hypothetical protein